MKILLTGGTGFVGGHAAAAITRAGHDLRLLVRRPEQVPASLNPLGVSVSDVVTGDVLDEAAVSRALDGCDAVVHAAAVFSLDPRDAEKIRRTNVRATELLLRGAAERGLDPIVHVSSTVTLTRYGGSGPDLPLGDITLPYTQSKIDSEKIARELQAEGHPVVSVYPGGVFGPHDPYRGDQNERLRWVLLGRFPMWPKGRQHVVDVRDTAEVLAAVLKPGLGARRYVVPGHHVDAEDVYGTLAKVTGRRYPHLVLPGSVMGPFTRGFDALQRRLPSGWRIPADHEGVELIRRDTKLDDMPAQFELGIKPRTLEETFRDTTLWMVESGRLPARYAGRAASHPV
ncbi:MAG TPA: NAD-dependent epimerase/dehydratase family protein [Micromonosporaceae bacterium]|jgi:nucleoside-diphosphate-sugar epimerase|nr:NAD-dependent epimerase/dehydratase family protein [Micromonosporaceae bacterium]